MSAKHFCDFCKREIKKPIWDVISINEANNIADHMWFTPPLLRDMCHECRLSFEAWAKAIAKITSTPRDLP